MTSAPIHASISVHDGPASNCVRSSTRTPVSALSIVYSPLPDASCLLASVLRAHYSFREFIAGMDAGLKPCSPTDRFTLRFERILLRCRIDELGRVLWQEQARLQQVTHNLAHALHIGRMAAVALFQGGTGVTLGQALCFA